MAFLQVYRMHAVRSRKMMLGLLQRIAATRRDLLHLAVLGTYSTSRPFYNIERSMMRPGAAISWGFVAPARLRLGQGPPQPPEAA